ncbi:MAG: radical SAM family heme chaperone HemW [Wenzhouxiangellaceae bacterium]|nr:radical SAM family heme chaperone HemW [Wenzhouxiangellaceae bacterium]MBS3746006.1 radical SAM family heme chaperone HemW [Wenzhouxiangellaceae bacterium]
MPLTLPPLSLYVHLPWCVAKCPYCDFNSHALTGDLPEQAYVEALMADLELDLPRVWGRTVHSVFFGGGTPSLFSARAIGQIIDGVSARLKLTPGAEITMEANPGTVEHDRFEAYRAAGVNRISLGIQTFDDAKLQTLGRIHDGGQARAAINAIKDAGFENFNLDLMWALPGQTVEQAVTDVETAISFDPPHISHYQLTIEPNTIFAARPPTLPGEETVWTMQDACGERLAGAGYQNYEISAWAKPNRACRHNLNYWRFGDYLGIGAGAAGKITLPAENSVLRTRRKKIPHSWMAAAEDGSFIAEQAPVAAEDIAFEYMLNRTRLAEPIAVAEFASITGLGIEALEPGLARAIETGLLEHRDIVGDATPTYANDRVGEVAPTYSDAGAKGNFLIRTERGARFLNDLQVLFLSEPER